MNRGLGSSSRSDTPSRIIRFAPLAVLAVLAAPPARAQQPAVGDLPSRIDHIFARFDHATPGCGVGLAKDGRTLYTHGYGSANLEYGVPNTDSTVFESGSVAKQFTAAALVLLAQDRKLSLDDDIRKYLPEVPAFGGQRITIRNLLTHTSGLRDQWGLLGIEGRGPGTQVHSPMTSLDLVAHQKMLNFPPGSEYLYSNTGYALAAIIVQRVSGKPLAEFTQERLFRPLGMTRTLWRDDFTTVVPNRATAYNGSAAAGFHTDMPFTNMIGNGGLLSTMADLMRWNENLDHPTVGGQAFVDAMQTRMRLTSGRTITYALGLGMNDYQGIAEVSHDGSTAGYRTFLARYPDQHVSVAVWCNYASASPATLGHQVADLVLTKATVAAPQASAAAATLPASAIAHWAGLYRDPHTDQAIQLVATESGLSTAAGGGGRGSSSWTSLAADHFRAPQGDVVFSGSGGHRNFALIRAGGDTSHFEEVATARTPLPLADYVGTYVSDELETVFVVAQREGKLVLQRRPYDELSLQPVYQDDFRAGGSLGSLRFVRGANGKVTGFSIFAGRVLDVRFIRADGRRP
jgi:CubicO group peptidase (beta-lactamase class C family)